MSASRFPSHPPGRAHFADSRSAQDRHVQPQDAAADQAVRDPGGGREGREPRDRREEREETRRCQLQQNSRFRGQSVCFRGGWIQFTAWPTCFNLWTHELTVCPFRQALVYLPLPIVLLLLSSHPTCARIVKRLAIGKLRCDLLAWFGPFCRRHCSCEAFVSDGCWFCLCYRFFDSDPLCRFQVTCWRRSDLLSAGHRLKLSFAGHTRFAWSSDANIGSEVRYDRPEEQGYRLLHQNCRRSFLFSRKVGTV